jgi:hypothetical protein
MRDDDTGCWWLADVIANCAVLKQMLLFQSYDDDVLMWRFGIAY